MISKNMFREALLESGAKQVSPAALKQFEAWMIRFMNYEAKKAVKRMVEDKRVRIEPEDIGE
jgi:histone H3/H4